MAETKSGNFWEKLTNIKNDSCCMPVTETKRPVEAFIQKENDKTHGAEINTDQSKEKCCS
ncbi:hypothetical protein CLV59_104534 [Chitinophaga dinghuensis]|uniref:Uncharacterized protein n=1 Tax=Chitinophaga dinghuensis TaxID=1539050 RepID=A0A327VZ92_9BACT|nr:hypothetical protein [Chitinophaga dinghuensis]RAJ82309.1 hypothetical protein CLV59_104534 [Chitinophaga dinghuensis]